MTQRNTWAEFTNAHHRQDFLLADLIRVIREPHPPRNLLGVLHAVQADSLHPTAYRLVRGNPFLNSQPPENDLERAYRGPQANLAG
jgi:hypothetical protein